MSEWRISFSPARSIRYNGRCLYLVLLYDGTVITVAVYQIAAPDAPETSRQIRALVLGSFHDRDLANTVERQVSDRLYLSIGDLACDRIRRTDNCYPIAGWVDRFQLSFVPEGAYP
jgi:hypothetical protein